MKYLIGIDVGTSGTKGVLFDENGHTVASALSEYPMAQPENGWAEEDPADWWNAACEALKKLVKAADGKEIAGLGLSGQMHSLVLLDEKGEVLRPAILWCDQRTGAERDDLERIVGREKLIQITANPGITGFTAAKILWVKKHEPDIWAKCRHILLAKDYIRYQLTGEFATDVSDAAGMQLLDVPKRQWSEEICRMLEIPLDRLAKVYESPDLTGRVSKEAARKTGLPEGLPVAGGAGDNAASAVGMGVVAEGKAFTTIGTSGVVFAPTTKPVIDPEGRVHTFCAASPGTWHVMGVTQAAGLSLNWFKHQLASDLSYREIDEACEKILPGSDRLLYLPYLMGERTPVLDADARGVFFGLSARHTRLHMARAVMEGVCFSLNDCVKILKEMNVSVNDMVMCGGGGKSLFWKQMLADVYGFPVKGTASDEGAALGAAILGGCAAGVYASVSDGCQKAVRAGNVTPPDAGRHETYLRFYQLYGRLYPALKSAFYQLKDL